MSKLEKLLEGVEVEWKTLGEVAIKISSGGTPYTGVSTYYNGDIPWLRTQEVGYGDIWGTEIKITELGLQNSSAKIIPENCVIVAMYGATVGKVGINKIPLSTNQACANIQLNQKVANFRYVYHFLLSQYEYIKSLGAGSQTNINAQIIKKLQIPIPPLSVQAEIVRILDTFTALTAELTAELTARKKQYSYYREQLLMVNGEGLMNNEEVEWKTLGEVLVRTKGTKITATEMRVIHKDKAPLKIFAGGKTVAFVNFDDIPEKNINKEPSIIVKSRGVIEFEYYNKPFSHKNEMWSYHSKNENINIKFVYYLLKINEPYFQN